MASQAMNQYDEATRWSPPLWSPTVDHAVVTVEREQPFVTQFGVGK